MREKDKLTTEEYAKERRKGEYIALIIGVVFFGVLIYWAETDRRSENSDLEERGVITTGVLTKAYYTVKGKSATEFDFNVNEIVYHGRDRNSGMWKNALFVGNIYKIIYDPINPNNANLLLDDNGVPIGIDNNGNEIHYSPYQEPLWLIVASIAFVVFMIVYRWKK